jgi:hypothetical protein
LEKAARRNDLTAPVTSGAGGSLRTGLCTGGITASTGIVLENFDFSFGAESGFFQSDLQIVSEIRSALAAASIPRTCSSAKQLIENAASALASHSPEYLSENIEWIVEPAAPKTSSASSCCSRRKRGVTKLVVGGPFVRVHEHLVSLADFFEFLFGRRVAWVLIGMIFYREPTVRFFEVFG